MILLDTNVVSELIRPHIDPAVARFAHMQPLADLFLPSLVVAEIRYGLHRLLHGQRRRALEAHFATFLTTGFAARILVFDADCAEGYATARTARERAGRPVSLPDALIGGMALAHGATLATRNTPHFDGYGLALVNPWQA